MPKTRDLLSVKNLVSPKLLKLSGVTGVGISGEKLAVYLDQDKPEIRQQVQQHLDSVADGVEAEFFESGTFRKF
jgi:tagatose-1,6-bisphosphate aldolase